MSQSEAVGRLISRAYSDGLTHIVIAGPCVSSWPLFGVENFEGYKVVNIDSSFRKSAVNLDRVYASFAVDSTDNTPTVLLLDTIRNHSVELTGIDAQKTDLIVQVSCIGVKDAEYNQLLGRALRMGRKGNPVHCLIR
jgi:hypothetical protein